MDQLAHDPGGTGFQPVGAEGHRQDACATSVPGLHRRLAPAPLPAPPPRRPKLRRHVEGAVETWSQLPDVAVKDIVPLESAVEPPPPAIAELRRPREGGAAPRPDTLAASDAAVLLEAVGDMRHLAELGELSAVVAHELRNPLAGIAATAEVLRDSFDVADDRCEGIEIILDEVARLDTLVRNLLDFARSRQPQLLATDIADDVDRVARAVAADAERAGVTLVAEAPGQCTPVLADSELIQQVFLNLAANALQAMPHGGTLAIRTLEPDVGSGFVCLEVADTGEGIGPDVLPRIFEPFFTTRAEAVGLGLAATRKLVERQGGYITVASEPGQGACFTVYLRRAGQGEVAREPESLATRRSAHPTER